MKCSKCGAENPENSKFCSECGAHFPETKTSPEPKTVVGKPVSKGRGINTKILVLVIVAILFVGAAAAYFLLPSLFSQPQQATVLIMPTVSGEAVVTVNGVSKTYKVDSYVLGIGSGFIVNDQGYIVTAAHVVGDPYNLEYQDKITKMESKDVDWYVAKYAVALWLSENLPTWFNNNTEADLDQLTNGAIQSGEVRVTRSQVDFYVAGPALPDSFNNKDYVAQIVDFEATDNQEKDLALLKIDNPPANLPRIAISSQKPKTGDTISIYGYPMEQIDFARYVSSTGNQEAFLESMANATLTRGIVSAERTSPKGIQYFQTDAAVNNGNSGGPVVNSNNQLVGVMVLGFGDTGSFNFFLSSQYVIDMLKQNGISF